MNILLWYLELLEKAFRASLRDKATTVINLLGEDFTRILLFGLNTMVMMFAALIPSFDRIISQIPFDTNTLGSSLLFIFFLSSFLIYSVTASITWGWAVFSIFWIAGVIKKRWKHKKRPPTPVRPT